MMIHVKATCVDLFWNGKSLGRMAMKDAKEMKRTILKADPNATVLFKHKTIHKPKQRECELPVTFAVMR